MEALAGLLTREQLLVELLVFKLVAMRQLMLAGETRFLPWAAEEVDRATAAVRDIELERAMLVSLVATERGLDDVSLTELLADAPEPWRGLLQQTHDQLRVSAREAQDLLQTTRRLAEVGVRSLAEAMGQEPAPKTYGRDAYAPAPRYEQVL